MTRADAGDLVVATATLARDPDEAALLRRSIAALASHGWPVFACDGGSDAAFLEAIGSVPGVTLVERAGPGLMGQMRASLAAAARETRGFVLYTESDKVQFFENDVARFVERASSTGAGVVLAARSPDALATFPAIQQTTEEITSRLCAEYLGVEGDYLYGPFLLAADLVPYLLRVSAELGWGWRHFMFALAWRLGRGVAHVPGDHRCPDDQRLEDDAERLHRLRQLAQNVNGLLLGLTADLAPAGEAPVDGRVRSAVGGAAAAPRSAS